MTSTSFILGTGLKKCAPQKRPKCSSPAVNSEIEHRCIAPNRNERANCLLQIREDAMLNAPLFLDGLNDQRRLKAILDRVYQIEICRRRTSLLCGGISILFRPLE